MRLESIERLSFRAAAMIKQLLTFSRKGRPEMAPFVLAPFLKETIKLHRISLPENIELKSGVPGEELIVHGDINLLQQVLINLLNNARHAVREVANPVIEIGVEAYAADREFLDAHPELTGETFARITVSDNGCGIAPELQEHVFEPFFTTKPVNEGTGLGLAMAFGAIESHDGTITLASEPGHGTRVEIYLPLLKGRADDLVEDVLDETMAGHGEVVLLVDDHEEALVTSRDVLKNLGYRVITATDGRSAVELFAQQEDSIDLVILDVVMPILGGKEACKEIRQIKPDVRVIFATGYDRVNVQSDPELSDVPVINKPFAIGKLSRAIRALLDG